MRPYLTRAPHSLTLRRAVRLLVSTMGFVIQLQIIILAIAPLITMEQIVKMQLIGALATLVQMEQLVALDTELTIVLACLDTSEQSVSHTINV